MNMPLVLLNRRRRGSVAFSPADLFAASEPGVWYDPSDLTTLFTDSTGLIPVTAAGQSVGKILDKSGRGNHATQTIPTRCPTYQVDGTGRPYLSFDGVDDGMVTNTITPGTDKVQVFAGVRKVAGTNGMILEASTNLSSNNGTFYLVPGNVATGGGPYYTFGSKGTIFASAESPANYTAPITNVLTGIGDIAGDSATLRANGTQVATSASDQGTGNFLAYQLYIGRRGILILPFNGHIYSLIVRFGPNLTTGQITSTESYVNSKTGAF
jgi:hypothetical protein